MASFFEELKRRNAFKVGIAYLAMTWLLMQVADLVLTTFDADRGIMQSLVIVFVVGFPIAEEDGYKNAMGWFADLWADRSAASGSLAWWVAYRYVRTGQDEKAIEWLEKAYEQRDPNLPFFEVPEFEHLRTEPRIRELMRRVGVI